MCEPGLGLRCITATLSLLANEFAVCRYCNCKWTSLAVIYISVVHEMSVIKVAIPSQHITNMGES